MLTRRQAYRVVFNYLQDVYESNRAQFDWDLPILLDNMQLLKDDQSSDPAQLHDWEQALGLETATADQVYAAMKRFLTAYQERGDSSSEISHILQALESGALRTSKPWDEHVEAVTALSPMKRP